MRDKEGGQADVRFYRGQVFENVLLKQEGIIVDVQGDGQMGLLRFFATDADEWVSIDDVLHSDEWRQNVALEEEVAS